MNDGEIIRADRKRALRFIVISAAVGLVLIAVLSQLYSYFKDAVPSADYPLTPERLEELRLQLRATMLALSVGMACCCIPVVIYGIRTVKHNAFPPPGSLVLRDTRVIRGRRAVWLGYCLLILGGSSTIASLVFGWLVDHMLAKGAL